VRLHERWGLKRAGRAILCVLAVVSTVSVRTTAIAAPPAKNAGATNGPPRLIVKLKATLAARAEATLPGVELSHRTQKATRPSPRSSLDTRRGGCLRSIRRSYR